MVIGKVLGNRYEILEKIGGGGMALVYKAKCRLLNRFVAIKILRPEFTGDEEFVKKFKRESQAAASLSHPNIVSIYDVGTENGIDYIVMEYIKGHTLKELIKSKGALGVEYATNIAIQISSALDHAHKNHIVHRDIKSHNIMIRDDNSVKVTDFGIARAVSSSTITNTGNIIGSVHYFSPEQARGGYTDEKSDIYSLGVVMYEMLTGRLPFEGESPIAVALKHLQETPARPTEINPKISKSLEEIVLKCMEKDISKRYATAAEIIADLKQSLVMPNGDFVRKHNVVDENTKIIEHDKLREEIKKLNGSLNSSTGALKDNAVPSESQKVKKNKNGDNSSKKVTIIAIILGLLLALIVFGGFILINSLFEVEEVKVPNLVGLDEQEANKQLKELGFIMDVTERVYNKEIPEGQIIKQEPQPNELNKVTNPVRVIVSKGPKEVIVPSIVNKSYDEVDYILESAGLSEGNVTQEYGPYPSGIVIRQSIEPGVSVPEGQKIDYVISGGPEKFFMPNLVGSNFEDVRKQLVELDLILGNTDYVYNSQYGKDVVIDQSIKSGSEVSKKSVIDLVISKGPEPSQSTNTFLKINLPQNLDKMKVTIYKIEKADGNTKNTRIYEEFHIPSDSPLKVPVTGSGQVIFEVYINNSFHDSIPYNF